MENPPLLDRVRALRGRGCTPQQIARALGVRPATVAPLVRAIAAEQPSDPGKSAAARFWVSPEWSGGLTVDGHPEWPGIDQPADPASSGLVSVMAARDQGSSRVSVCGYLVDAYCLGVKDVWEPRGMDLRKLPAYLAQFFRAYDAPPLAAPAELARHLVFGAVEYARTLGFEPATGFDACIGHLGPWAGPSAIRFGRDGKPLFIQGPYDDPASVMATLQRSVGQDNFHFLVGA